MKLFKHGHANYYNSRRVNMKMISHNLEVKPII